VTTHATDREVAWLHQPGSNGYAYTLYLAYRDPRVPLYAKVFAACVVAYAFSPIDLIPDFIPVLGMLDDLIIVPVGIFLALKMIPQDIISDCRLHAHEASDRPENWFAAAVVVSIWLALAGLGVMLLMRLL
jgi:uncharacterized membrane protein YkvA (DUF1232 family)